MTDDAEQPDDADDWPRLSPAVLTEAERAELDAARHKLRDGCDLRDAVRVLALLLHHARHVEAEARTMAAEHAWRLTERKAKRPKGTPAANTAALIVFLESIGRYEPPEEPRGATRRERTAHAIAKKHRISPDAAAKHLPPGFGRR
jgi:hypothetical protein